MKSGRAIPFALVLALSASLGTAARATPAHAQAAAGSVSTASTADSDPPPSAPSVVTAVALSGTEVLLDWTAVTDAEGGVDHYKVYRDGAHVASPTTITYTDTGLQPATTYRYRVSAVDSKNREGAKSDEVSVTTLEGDDDDGEADDTPPTKPANLQADAVGPRRIDVDWDAASDPESGIDSYRVYRDGADIGATTGTSFADTGVEPETSYTYEVSAVNGDGLEGEKSDPASATTPAEAETDDTPPTQPANLQADAVGPRRIDLDWDAASDPESGIDSYRVYRDGADIGATTGTSFADTGVEPETSYTYEVSAVNGDGLEGEKSEPASATTPAEADGTPPTRPANLQADAVGPRRIDLDWDAASDPESGIDSYRVYRNGTRIASPSGTSYSDTGVEPETSYTYEVSAVNGDGLGGERSDPASATTPAEADTVPPAAPTRLRIIR